MFKIECKHIKTEKQTTQTKITFSCVDVDDLDLIQINKSPGYLVFSTDPLKEGIEKAMKDVKLGIKDGQSPSKRLRGALFQYWFEKKQDVEWEEFYISKIDNIIKMVNDTL